MRPFTQRRGLTAVPLLAGCNMDMSQRRCDALSIASNTHAASSSGVALETVLAKLARTWQSGVLGKDTKRCFPVTGANSIKTLSSLPCSTMQIEDIVDRQNPFKDLCSVKLGENMLLLLSWMQ